MCSNNRLLNSCYVLATATGICCTLLTHLLLSQQQQAARLSRSVHQFQLADTHGQLVPLQRYAGRVLLIVNIASRCGLTRSQYEGLARLRKEYAEQGLRILCFPCNQFGAQMPEADGAELLAHMGATKLDIGVLFAKLHVNGEQSAPLYELLKRQTGGADIEWNFAKFLIDQQGYVHRRYAPQTTPTDLAEDIQQLLLTA